MKRVFLTDKEVAAVLEVSPKTLYRMLSGFTPTHVRASGRIDLADAKPVEICGRRRWRPVVLANVLGISLEGLEWLTS